MSKNKHKFLTFAALMTGCGNRILACMSRDFGTFMPKHLAGLWCVNSNHQVTVHW